MKPDRADWRIESDPSSQMVFAVVSALLGLALIAFVLKIPVDDGDGSSRTTRHAVLALGGILLVIGAWLGFNGGKTVVSVSPRRRVITIEQQGRWSSSQRTVPFADIASFQVDESGDSEGGSISYHVVMTLRNGPPVNLFLGFFAGRRDRVVMQERCDRLQALVQAVSRQGRG